MTYDQRCYNLAEAFLEDNRILGTKENMCQLAYHIQTLIDEWIEDREIEESRRQLDDHTISTHACKYE